MTPFKKHSWFARIASNRSLLAAAVIFTVCLGAAGRAEAAALYEWATVGSPDISDGLAVSNNITLDANGLPYVAYSDAVHSGGVTVKKFDGTAWTTVGTAGFSTGGVAAPEIRFNPTDNVPYVVYGDNASSTAITVKKFNGTAWETVGPTEGFSPGRANFTTLAFDSSGTPYVAFTDEASSTAMSVMKFNGSNWVFVGTEGFSSSSANYDAIAIDSSGVPYVAYQDTAASSGVTVQKFNGSSWELVGTAGFTAGSSNDVDMAFDSSDTPYVVYRDGGNGNKASVMKFNGTAWVPVGTIGFSAGVVTSTSIAIDASGTPYIAYKDESQNNRTTAEYFDGGAWHIVGGASASGDDTDTNYVDIAVSTSSIPYVVYKDSGGLTNVMRYQPLQSYKLSFDTAGGSSVSSQTVQKTAATTLPAAPTRSGYDFQGWNTVADGTGTSYAVSDSYTMPASDVTLYAIWQAQPVQEETDTTTHHHSSGGSVQSQVANLTAMGNTAAADTLKTQWPQLFAGTVPASSSTASSTAMVSLMARDLELGMTGSDVLALQKLLNANGFSLAASGVGSAGNETDYFGTLTQAAVAAYQKANGVTPTAGYFGPLTRASMTAKGISGLWW
jgi:uncharacterized repeat protein (TIGR02543 family)